MPRRGNAHRLLRWLWTSRRPDARLARLALIPASELWQGAMAARARAYARGWLQVQDLPLPCVSVGNLSLGGSGKSAVASWAANRYLAQGVRPAILAARALPDELEVQRRHAPGAVVLGESDIAAAADRAVVAGAQVLILDDAYQRLDVHRDLNIAVVSAETAHAVRWALPAGPWREGWAALDRADAAVVTRKRAPREAAEAAARAVARRVSGPVGVAHLGLRHLEGLVSGSRHPAALLAGKRVVAASRSPDPDAFVAQTKAAGAAVQVAAWRDQPDFRDEDVAWLAHATRRADHVVITERDAVKLRDRWPNRVPEPLVAVPELTWEDGEEALADALDAATAPVERL
ncbi:MAG TPA: tetraacyldisaccharide 4'-kinase [Gemmatimonadales bacterium]|nr:tetraacyldisaccharide 4'-kinase [Gemmatimonadales bacterium]